MKKMTFILTLAAMLCAGCQTVEDEECELIVNTVGITVASIFALGLSIVLLDVFFGWLIEVKTIQMRDEIEEIHRLLRENNSKIYRADSDMRECWRETFAAKKRLDKMAEVLINEEGKDT